MTDRLTIRLAYQRGWQVVDGSAIIQTFDTEEGAFQYLVDRGARVHLQWSRTVIAGGSRPYDFSADFQSDNAGRIMKQQHPPMEDKWLWFSGSTHGTVDTKDEAVLAVERAYTRKIAKADWPK